MPAAGSKPDFRCALKTGIGYFTDDPGLAYASAAVKGY